jgi:hypothetical protein
MANVGNSIKITKQVDLGFDDILNGFAELDTKDLEKFMLKMGHLIARRKVVSLPERESELFMKINKAIPSTLQKRYENLLTKNREETITPTEHVELLKVIEKIETKNAERLEYLIELSQIRNISLDLLMRQLHLNPFQDDKPKD